MINERKQLGKISKITLGKGGYDDAMFGMSLTFQCGEHTSVGTFVGHWRGERGENAKWTEQSRLEEFGKLMLRIDAMLKAAKVDYFQQLEGVPVELYYLDGKLKDWRILTEVL